jgi:hypothetical protein
MGNNKYTNHMYASQITPTTSSSFLSTGNKLTSLNTMGRFVDNDIILPTTINTHDPSHNNNNNNTIEDNSLKRIYS